jgi:hypothetical protein
MSLGTATLRDVKTGSILSQQKNKGKINELLHTDENLLQ